MIYIDNAFATELMDHAKFQKWMAPYLLAVSLLGSDFVDR